MILPGLPVLRNAGRVIADTIGEVVPEEIKPREEVEIASDSVLPLLEIGVRAPLVERFCPGPSLEKPL